MMREKLNLKGSGGLDLNFFRSNMRKVETVIKKVELNHPSESTCFQLFNVLTKEECEFLITHTEKLPLRVLALCIGMQKFSDPALVFVV